MKKSYIAPRIAWLGLSEAEPLMFGSNNDLELGAGTSNEYGSEAPSQTIYTPANGGEGDPGEEYGGRNAKAVTIWDDWGGEDYE